MDIIQKEHKEMYGIVVFSQDNFDKQYSKESRTYVFSNNNEAFLKTPTVRQYMVQILTEQM